MAKRRFNKNDFSLEMVFGVTRHKTVTYRKEIDAPTEADAVKMAEDAGSGFEEGATLVGSNIQVQLEPAKPAPESRSLPDGFLTISQAAVRMNVTERWLYRHWKALHLGTKVSHRQVRLSERAIERYLKMRQPAP